MTIPAAPADELLGSFTWGRVYRNRLETGDDVVSFQAIEGVSVHSEKAPSNGCLFTSLLMGSIGFGFITFAGLVGLSDERSLDFALRVLFFGAVCGMCVWGLVFTESSRRTLYLVDLLLSSGRVRRLSCQDKQEAARFAALCQQALRVRK